ncbi:alpha/beta fold hydrolase [Nakamurella leprariae]|uniref:Alpha/beta fold hydrolase n=1 Tax=Nakamurella leprariae TaxID=2803911 RepID=A0A938YEF4_9ACTN|nr:alpha/beta hydrolase [Nakamurella leprariae]MBM9466355.1 alpha/beta fold hydrolase [Nakamurella leprariae]
MASLSTLPLTHKTYVDAPHGQVHVRMSGDPGGVPLVLLHQVASSSLMWEAIMEPLARRGYRVMAVDLPGYGNSDPMPSLPTLSEYGQVVGDAVAALGYDSAHWFGHHTGSSVSMTIAAERPDRVRAVAVWGLALFEADDPVRIRIDEELPPVYTADGDDVLADWRRRWEISSASVAPRVVARSTAEFLLAGEHRPDGHNTVGRTDHRPIFRAVTRPVLAAVGEREMLLDHTIAAMPLLQHGEFVNLGDVGIDVADEAPELLCDTLDAFYGRHS